MDGAANEALVAVELVSGHTGRTKLVAVTGVSVGEAAKRLAVE